jgi:hypothetical protein
MASQGSREMENIDHNSNTLRMVDYIKANFREILGSDVDLLDHPDGLELLRDKYSMMYRERARKAA